MKQRRTKYLPFTWKYLLTSLFNCLRHQLQIFLGNLTHMLLKIFDHSSLGQGNRQGFYKFQHLLLPIDWQLVEPGDNFFLQYILFHDPSMVKPFDAPNVIIMISGQRKK